ncbi:MAG: hypothetical protein IT256_00815 [Chitinophagaceae bacterium]|nr:hypothetical protein [Chitinophagaceae bacterium]
MNTALLKAKMDKFFADVSPEYLVKEFEKMGYTFIDSDINWEPPKNYNFVTNNCESIDDGILTRIFRSRKKMNPSKKLTSEYPGSFFYLKLA